MSATWPGEPDPRPEWADVLMAKARRVMSTLEGRTMRRCGHLHVSDGDYTALLRHLEAPEDGSFMLFARPVIRDADVAAGEVKACLGPVPEPIRALVIGGTLDGRWVTLEREHDVLDARVEPLLIPPGEQYTLTVAHAFGRHLRLYVGVCDDLDALLAKHLLVDAADTIERSLPRVPNPHLN